MINNYVIMEKYLTNQIILAGYTLTVRKKKYISYRRAR